MFCPTYPSNPLFPHAHADPSHTHTRCKDNRTAVRLRDDLGGQCRDVAGMTLHNHTQYESHARHLPFSDATGVFTGVVTKGASSALGSLTRFLSWDHRLGWIHIPGGVDDSAVYTFHGFQGYVRTQRNVTGLQDGIIQEKHSCMTKSLSPIHTSSPPVRKIDRDTWMPLVVQGRTKVNPPKYRT